MFVVNPNIPFRFRTLAIASSTYNTSNLC